MADFSGLELRKEHVDSLLKCELVLGYTFRNRELLFEALTHASGASTRLKSNERLEFLGDSILGFTVCEVLYNRYPDWLEGELTKIKSMVVSRATCARVGRNLGLEEFLVLGKGVTSESEVPESLIANAFESIVAGIYLDGGFEPAKSFICKHMDMEIKKAIDGKINANYKSALQQLAQREMGEKPIYELVDEKGPDHNKYFRVCAKITNATYHPAWGRNKKEAEQRAAANALAQLQNRDVPFIQFDFDHSS